jgi:hypothetical protein
MIWGAVVVARPEVQITQRKIVGLYVALLMLHGILNTFSTKYLARLTAGFVFINIGAAIGKENTSLLIPQRRNFFSPAIIIVLLTMTGRDNMHSANYVFGSAGLINQTKGWSDGLSFLFGLLSVQWTVSGNNFCHRRRRSSLLTFKMTVSYNLT